MGSTLAQLARMRSTWIGVTSNDSLGDGNCTGRRVSVSWPGRATVIRRCEGWTLVGKASRQRSGRRRTVDCEWPAASRPETVRDIVPVAPERTVNVMRYTLVETRVIV